MTTLTFDEWQLRAHARDLNRAGPDGIKGYLLERLPAYGARGQALLDALLFETGADSEFEVLEQAFKLMRDEDRKARLAKARQRKGAQKAGIQNWSALDWLTAKQVLQIESVLSCSFETVVPILPPDDELHSLMAEQGWEIRQNGQRVGVFDVSQVNLALRHLNFNSPVIRQQLELHVVHGRTIEVAGALPRLMSERGLRAVIDGYRWLEGRPASTTSLTLEPLAARYLMRFAPELRYALLHELVPLSAPLKLRDLNFSQLAKARRSPRAVLEALPRGLQWTRLTGLPSAGLALGPLEGFKVGVLKRICAEHRMSLDEAAHRRKVLEASTGVASGLSVMRGDLQAVYNLVRLFGDYESIRRFVRASGEPWTRKGIHDSGQFTLPRVSGFTPAKWAPLCMRHPAAVSKSREFSTLEAKGVFPQSLMELRTALLELNYPKFSPQTEGLRKVCLEYGITGSTAAEHLAYWKKAKVKDAEFIPALRLCGTDVGLDSAWQFYRLAANDWRGPLLGELTGCCQHLCGAGSASARAGVESPHSGFYVVTKAGKVMAQSWAWRSVDGAVVFDSWEARCREKEVLAAVSAFVAEAATRLVAGPLQVTSVLLGDTSSGITSSLAKSLTHGSRVYKVKPADRKGYFDGERQLLLAGTAPKAVVPPPKANRIDRMAVFEEIGFDQGGRLLWDL